MHAFNFLNYREFVAGSNMTRQYTPISVPTPGELTFKVLIKVSFLSM